MRKTCDFENARSHISLTFCSLLLLFLLPFGTWFGCYFWRQVNALPQESGVPRMTRVAVETFTVSTTCYLWLIAVTKLLPLLKALSLFDLSLCVSMKAVTNVIGGVAYLAFQRVLLERLKVSFANTPQAIGRRVAIAFDFLQLCVALGCVHLLYAATKPCIFTWRIYELPGAKWYTDCRTHFKTVFALMYGVIFIFVNVAIAVMYVLRMKAVFLDSNLAVAELNSDISMHAAKNMIYAMDLMRKSTVIAIWSVASTLLAFISFTFSIQLLATTIDLVLNEVLIYCLFPVGDDLYDTLLGFCHFTVDCYLPKRTLDIELDYIDEITAAPRNDQSTTDGLSNGTEVGLFVKPETDD